MARLKQQITPVLTTRDDAETAMNDLALAVNNQRKLCAARDQYILQVNERYAADLADLEKVVQAKTQDLRAWAELNPNEFPPGRKSLDLLSGTLGFRTGTPKLATLSKLITWDKVLDLIHNFAPDFIRTKQEVDKEAVLRSYSEGVITEESLRSCGLKIIQSESFFVEPDLTKLQ